MPQGSISGPHYAPLNIPRGLIRRASLAETDKESYAPPSPNARAWNDGRMKVSRLRYLAKAEAIKRVVIHHSGGLHKGIADSRAYEPESSAL